MVQSWQAEFVGRMCCLEIGGFGPDTQQLRFGAWRSREALHVGEMGEEENERAQQATFAEFAIRRVMYSVMKDLKGSESQHCLDD